MSRKRFEDTITKCMMEEVRCSTCNGLFERFVLTREGQCKHCRETSEIEEYIENLAVCVERLQVTRWLQDYDRRRKAGLV